MSSKYKMIDLCAGIGGIRRGYELAGAFVNVLSAEIDKNVIMLVGASLAISVGAFIMYRTGGLYVVDDDFYSRMTVFNSYGFSYGIVGSAIVMGIASVASLMLIMPHSKEIEKERRMQKQNANTFQ